MAFPHIYLCIHNLWTCVCRIVQVENSDRITYTLASHRIHSTHVNLQANGIHRRLVFHFTVFSRVCVTDCVRLAGGCCWCCCCCCGCFFSTTPWCEFRIRINFLVLLFRNRNFCAEIELLALYQIRLIETCARVTNHMKLFHSIFWINGKRICTRRIIVYYIFRFLRVVIRLSVTTKQRWSNLTQPSYKIQIQISFSHSISPYPYLSASVFFAFSLSLSVFLSHPHITCMHSDFIHSNKRQRLQKSERRREREKEKTPRDACTKPFVRNDETRMKMRKERTQVTPIVSKWIKEKKNLKKKPILRRYSAGCAGVERV